MSDTWDPELLQWQPAGKRVIAHVKAGRSSGNVRDLAETNSVYGLALSSDFTGGLPAAYTTRELASGVVTRSYWPGIGYTRPEGERFGVLRTIVWGYLNNATADKIEVQIEHIDGERYEYNCYEVVTPDLRGTEQNFGCSHETYIDAAWDGVDLAVAVTLTNVGNAGDVGIGGLTTTVTWEPLS